jgi:predicted peptidase
LPTPTKPSPPPLPVAAPGRWEADHLGGLPCRVLLPHDYQPARFAYPLVLFLHGSGERGSDNHAQLRHGVAGFNAPTVRARHPAIVVAPQAPAGGNWGGSWYGGRTPIQDQAIAIARELATRGSVDADRVYLAGLSMGAIGGWDLLVRATGLFAAALLVCGDPDPANAEALRDLPIWSLHGGADDVVRPDNDRAIAARIAALGGELRYTELPGVGHEAWTPVFADDAVHDWLFAQRRHGP